MAKTREIRKRIKAVANIRRITKTMQMIATSKFARAQQRAVGARPYTQGIFELVSQIGGASGNVSHPLIAGPSKPTGGELTLVITSERGLCGPYNGSILRAAMAHLRSTPAADPSSGGVLEVIGKKGAGFFRYGRVPVAATHAIGDRPGMEEIEPLARRFMEMFTSGAVSAVRVVSMRYISAGRQTPEVLQLLPLRPPESKGESAARALHEFSPPAEELLDDLLPAAVRVTLMQCVNDALVSEHVARMVAMKAATDNAQKMGKRFSRLYNRARQAQITTELNEIVSGAAALN